jgi:hypothetical protein
MKEGLEHGDPELAAMSAVLAALNSLDNDARSRVINWVVGKLDVTTTTRTKARSSGAGESAKGDDDEAMQGETEYSDFPTLCTSASPGTDAQKALVAGYWFQVCQGQENFGSQDCNNQLKHFGIAVGNITRAFESLKNSTPRLVMQVQKSGKTKQARKKYKLTHQGIEEVKRMLHG